MPILKKNGKLRVYIYFRNLSLMSLKYEYPKLIFYMLFNSLADNKILNFMNDNIGYN